MKDLIITALGCLTGMIISDWFFDKYKYQIFQGIRDGLKRVRDEENRK